MPVFSNLASAALGPLRAGVLFQKAFEEDQVLFFLGEVRLTDILRDVVLAFDGIESGSNDGRRPKQLMNADLVLFADYRPVAV